MGHVRGLSERNGAFYARIVVPVDLRPAFNGKTEFRQRLGTDRRNAERDVHAVLARFYRDIKAARGALAAPTGENRSAPRSPAPPDLARIFYAEELIYDDIERLAETRGYPAIGLKDDHKLYEMALRKIASRRATNEEIDAHIGYGIDALMAKGLVAVEFGSTEWRHLGESLAAVKLEAMQRQIERDSGDFAGEPKHPMLADKVTNEPESKPTTPSTNEDAARILGPESLLPLSEVVARMHGEKRGIRPATQQEQRIAIRWFEEFIGEPLPTHRITRRMVLKYKDALLSVPVLYTQRFPGKTLPVAIEANKRRAHPYPTLSPTTINNKWLTHLKSTFTWAFQNDFIPDNPAQGIRLNLGKADAEPTKFPFTMDDLTKILSSPSFVTKLGERQWAVLIALHTGLRASEIAQLRLDGIRDERGIQVFATGDQLKNEVSRRIVPIHPDLITWGLAEVIAERRAAGNTHLFPEWHDRGRKLVEAASARNKSIQQPYSVIHPRWFNRELLKELGIDRRKTFHSLRHTFKTALSIAGVSRDISDALTGHADKSAGGHYIHAASIEAMAEAVAKLSFIRHRSEGPL